MTQDPLISGCVVRSPDVVSVEKNVKNFIEEIIENWAWLMSFPECEYSRLLKMVYLFKTNSAKIIYENYL